MLIISPQIKIALSEFEFSYVRSSGPGGQNVNKVNSKAVLRWNIFQNDTLPLEVKIRLQSQQGSKITKEGELLISSDIYRDQIRNRDECLKKLREIVAQAAVKPKARKKTKQSYSSTQRDKKQKSQHSEKKQNRKFSGHHD